MHAPPRLGCDLTSPSVTMGVSVALLLLLGSRPTLGTLREAVEANDPAAVHAALEVGADINEIGADGMTFFQRGVLVGKFKAARALHVAGADISIGDRDGYTALHVAALTGHTRVVKWLLKLGVETSPMHADGFTPLHRACWGAEAKHTDTVWALLDAGVPPDEPSADGQLPLAMASGNDNTRKLLLEALSEQQRARRG